MDSDDVASTFIGILIVGLLIVGVVAFLGFHRDGVDKECKEKFGSSWVGKTPAYNPDFCVNDNGDVKYLQ